MAAAMTISSALAAMLLCLTVLLAACTADEHVDGGRHGNHKPKNDDLVAKVCADVASHYIGPRVTKEFCESALRSDKRSAASRHPRDLALIAIDLVQHGAASADAKVERVLRSGAMGKGHNKETPVNLRLRYCRLDYGDMAGTVPLCRAMVQDYKPGHGHHGSSQSDVYMDCVGRLSNAAVDCLNHIFINDNVKKAVLKEVDEVVNQAALAKAMLEQMLGIVDGEH